MNSFKFNIIIYLHSHIISPRLIMDNTTCNLYHLDPHHHSVLIIFKYQYKKLRYHIMIFETTCIYIIYHMKIINMNISLTKMNIISMQLVKLSNIKHFHKHRFPNSVPEKRNKVFVRLGYIYNTLLVTVNYCLLYTLQLPKLIRNCFT